MSELEELYQEVIIDHSRSPRNFHALKEANRQAEGYNPLCGDHFKVYLRVENDVIKEIGFEGTGCAISKASASMMTGSVKGKTVAEAKALFEEFRDLFGLAYVEGGTGRGETTGFDRASVHRVGSGVRERWKLQSL